MTEFEDFEITDTDGKVWTEKGHFVGDLIVFNDSIEHSWRICDHFHKKCLPWHFSSFDEALRKAKRVNNLQINWREASPTRIRASFDEIAQIMSTDEQ